MNTSNWSNTLLVPWQIARDPRILAVPPGIGISWFADSRELTKIKSKYLLLDKFSYSALRKNNQLKYITSTSLGYFFINEGAL